MSLSEEHRRIHEEWHRAIIGQNLDDLMALYAENAAIDSTAVLVLERDPSGILRGKDRLRAHFQAFFDLTGPGDGEWHRLSAVASSGGTLIWEYPSAAGRAARRGRVVRHPRRPDHLPSRLLGTRRVQAALGSGRAGLSP